MCQLGKLINRIPASRLLISSYHARSREHMLKRSASLAVSTSILEALPGKLDINRHSSSILYIYLYRHFTALIIHISYLHVLRETSLGKEYRYFITIRICTVDLYNFLRQQGRFNLLYHNEGIDSRFIQLFKAAGYIHFIVLLYI